MSEECEEKLGKIEHVYFGFGGYQEAITGLWLTFSMKGSGVSSGISGAWNSEPDKYCKWTKEDQIKQNGEMINNVVDILKKAKVDRVDKLKNVPVKLFFEGNLLKKWEILEEVL